METNRLFEAEMRALSAQREEFPPRVTIKLTH